MSHETHQDAHGQQEKRSVISLRSSFWFVIIVVFLFISAINFVDAFKNGKEEGKETAKKEMSVAPAENAAPASAPAAAVKDTAAHK